MPRHTLACLLTGALSCLLLSTAPSHAQDVLITELMASNTRTLADEDGAFSDWAELYNPGDTAVNLDGWYITDTASNKTKWRFPAVTIAPRSFLVVFASNKNRTDPTKPLHTNFALSAGGEYLGLIKPDGVTVSSEYAPTFPAAQGDVSYGMLFEANEITPVPASAPARAIVPPNNTLGTTWTAVTFNDSAWHPGTTGVGYERGSGYEPLIGLDVGNEMFNVNPTAFIRIPFTVADPSRVDRLTLRMKYDDGFVAYLNGQEIASANAPSTLWRDSPATAIHDDSLSVQYQDFDVTADADSLLAGDNVLAIQGLNAGSASSDFLILPELTGTAGVSVFPDTKQAFMVPTPGAPNIASVDEGPRISQAAHTPTVLNAGNDLHVTTRVDPTAAAVADVTLHYRVNFGPTGTLSMADDGASGDGAAADGVYGATIPNGNYSNGQMVRYYITATDAATHATRLPRFVNPGAEPEYFGTMVTDPSVVTGLPVLCWFVEFPDAAPTEAGTRASIFYNGAFHDNIYVRMRGNTSIYWPKKNFKFEMNSGSYFRYDPNEALVDEFNLQSTYSDKTYMRQVLAWGTYHDAGVPGCKSFHMRVQQNGAFYSVAEWVEQPDETMLARNGLDPNGALYKMENEVTSSTEWVEKKTRKSEDNSDLQALVDGVRLTGTSLKSYLFDNVDIPEVINYIAATTLMHDNDHMAKNFYLYRDSDRTGEWRFLPWDKDLTFGRNFTLEGGVLNDTMWADYDPYSHPLFGDAAHPKVDGPWNRLIDAIFREPSTRRMYLRRLRTVMDDLLQPPGTPTASLKYETRVDELAALIGQDAATDHALWVTYGEPQDLATAVSIMKTSYFARRRSHLFNTHVNVTKLIPAAQAARPALRIGVIEREPSSGNQDEQYIRIDNPGPVEVDISGWTLTGEVGYTFRPGTVVPAYGNVYVTPNVRAFRARASYPNGGSGLLVQGNTTGHLGVAPSPLQLRTDSGALIAVAGYDMGDALATLRIAAGLNALSAGDLGLLDLCAEGASASTVDLADAIRMTQVVVSGANL